MKLEKRLKPLSGKGVVMQTIYIKKNPVDSPVYSFSCRGGSPGKNISCFDFELCQKTNSVIDRVSNLPWWTYCPPLKILDSKTSSLDPNLLHNQSSQLRLAVSNERWRWTGTLPMLPSQCFLLFFGAFFLFAGMSVILCLQVFLLLSADLLSVHQIIYQIHRDQKLEKLGWSAGHFFRLSKI